MLKELAGKVWFMVLLLFIVVVVLPELVRR
jgi:hypothetical protein